MQMRIGEKGSSCPVWRCGFNSAEVFGNPIHELHLGGGPNEAGIRIAQVIPGKKVPEGFDKLDVVGDRLVLRKANGAAIGGKNLVGTVLVLAREDGPVANLVIAAHDKVHRWAKGTAPTDAYAFAYTDLDGVTGLSVCGGDDPRAVNAVVLGGETYDLETKQVNPGAGGWFTLACAGSAAAKLLLLDYGPQSSQTTPAQRQATLKMITADYCGDGTAYTENGTPLLWENVSGSVELDAQPGAVEAVWTAAGALCLDATRIADVSPGCALPACDDFDLGDGEWITYLPNPT
ncbi:MAG TPA: ADYC domain-containing protein [Nannocystis sp.]